MNKQSHKIQSNSRNEQWMNWSRPSEFLIHKVAQRRTTRAALQQRRRKICPSKPKIHSSASQIKRSDLPSQSTYHSKLETLYSQDEHSSCNRALQGSNWSHKNCTSHPRSNSTDSKRRIQARFAASHTFLMLRSVLTHKCSTSCR